MSTNSAVVSTSRGGKRANPKGNRRKHRRGFILKPKLSQPSSTSSTAPAMPERPEFFDASVTVRQLFFLAVAKAPEHSVCTPVGVQDTVPSSSASSSLELFSSPL